MQIEFTKKEFRRLLDMVYIGNWILNSARGDDRFADYDNLESKLFALCRENGMDALVERWHGEDVPSKAFSDGGIHEAIMDYEDTVFYEILHHKSGFFIDDDRSHRNLDDEIFSCLAETFLFHAVLAVFCFIFLFVFKVHQGSEITIRLKNDISAASAVSAVRTSLRYKRFASEGNRAVSAFSGFDKYFRSIYKHLLTSFPVIVLISLFKAMKIIDKKTLCIRRCTGSITLN